MLGLAAGIIIAATSAMASPQQTAKAQPLLFSAELSGQAKVLVYVVNQGDPFLVGQADTNGSVQLALPYDKTLKGVARTNDGYVNFMALVVTENAFRPIYFAKTFTAGSWSSGSTPAVPTNLDPMSADCPSSDNPKVMVTCGFRAPGVLQALGKSPDVCASVLLGTSDPYTTVGEIHTGSDMTDKLTYGKTADTDMGVGTTAGTGSWHLGGTVHIGNSDTASVTWSRGAERGLREKSKFHFEKRHWDCGGPQWDEIKATAWEGGAVDGGVNHYLDHQCSTTYRQWEVAHAPGTTFGRSSNSYATFFAEVTAFGVGLSSQSGNSTWVTIGMTFTQTSGNRYICGNDNWPSSSHHVYAGT